MTQTRSVAADPALNSKIAPSHVLQGTDPVVLSAIRAPEITLALWHRPPSEGIAGYLAGLGFKAIDDLHFETSGPSLDQDVRDGLIEAGYPDLDARDALAADIVALSRRFMVFMDENHVVIRLEVVEDDACRRFHTDYVTARLICTYTGPGTEWLDQADATALANNAPPTALTIHQLSAGEAGVFKGRLWAPDTAISHRSPPIAGTGQQRLVLVINPGREPEAVVV